MQIEKRLNEDFKNLCDWFVDSKFSIHFGEDKTKSILFTSKQRAKSICQLNIKYKGINIKQHSEVTYLGCMLDKTISGEPMQASAYEKQGHTIITHLATKFRGYRSVKSCTPPTM